MHSEYTNTLVSPTNARYSAFKKLVNKAHPLSRFNCGNLDTLQNVPNKLNIDVV